MVPFCFPLDVTICINLHQFASKLAQNGRW